VRNVFSENISIPNINIICAEATQLTKLYTLHWELSFSIILLRGSKAYQKMLMGRAMVNIGELGFTGIRACTR